jgi:hypothetical protein
MVSPSATATTLPVKSARAGTASRIVTAATQSGRNRRRSMAGSQGNGGSPPEHTGGANRAIPPITGATHGLRLIAPAVNHHDADDTATLP